MSSVTQINVDFLNGETHVGGALSGRTGSRWDWLKISSNCGQWLCLEISMGSIRSQVSGFDLQVDILCHKRQQQCQEGLRLTPFSSTGDELLRVNNIEHSLGKY